MITSPLRIFTNLGIFCFWTFLISGCGDFATTNSCTPNADPTCQADNPAQFTLPNLTGPNPQFPIPQNAPPARNGRFLGGPGLTPVLLNELFLDPMGLNANRQQVELWNSGNIDFNLSGYTLNLSEQKIVFSQDQIIPAGQFLVIHLGQVGFNDTNDLFHSQIQEVDSKQGFAALITDTGVIADYVQWGTTGQALESYAVQEKQWSAKKACAVPVEGTALSLIGGGNEVSDFAARFPTLGAPNI